MPRQPDPQVADQVMSYVSGARWFAGKGRSAVLEALTPLPWLSEPGETLGSAVPAVRFEIAEIGYGPGEQDRGGPASSNEYYQLAMAYRSAPRPELQHAEIGRLTDPELGPLVAYDAAQDPDACRVIVRSLLAGRQIRSPETEVRFTPTNPEALSGDLTPRVFTGQQSNTSVMLGEAAILKLFRRLEFGRNLDIEVHEALNKAQVEGVAGLYGWVEGSWVSNGRQLEADLAMAVEKLADAEDGWGVALERLRAGQSFAADAEALGRELAAIHRAMRAAFATARVLGAKTAAVMSDRLGRAAVIAPDLARYTNGLRAAFDELGATTLDTQRVHGDFHLGQTLHTPSGWKIIDFEGEPAKSMAERVLPDSVWRDIAGMLRSFDYAAASVPGPASAAWAEECRSAFLRGYTGGELSSDEAAVLRAYEADKAIYEVVYEVRNRPDWVGIPLAAVALLADPSDSSALPDQASVLAGSSNSPTSVE